MAKKSLIFLLLFVFCIVLVSMNSKAYNITYYAYDDFNDNEIDNSEEQTFIESAGNYYTFDGDRWGIRISKTIVNESNGVLNASNYFNNGKNDFSTYTIVEKKINFKDFNEVVNITLINVTLYYSYPAVFGFCEYNDVSQCYNVDTNSNIQKALRCHDPDGDYCPTGFLNNITFVLNKSNSSVSVYFNGTLNKTVYINFSKDLYFTFGYEHWSDPDTISEITLSEIVFPIVACYNCTDCSEALKNYNQVILVNNVTDFNGNVCINISYMNNKEFYCDDGIVIDGASTNNIAILVDHSDNILIDGCKIQQFDSANGGVTAGAIVYNYSSVTINNIETDSVSWLTGDVDLGWTNNTIELKNSNINSAVQLFYNGTIYNNYIDIIEQHWVHGNIYNNTIVVLWPNNGEIYNNTIEQIYLESGCSSNIYNNTFKPITTSNSWIYHSGGGEPTSCRIYKNIFNKTNICNDVEGSATIYDNKFLDYSYNPDTCTGGGKMYWNTTKTAGTNIVNGPYIGGNYWWKSDGTGFSQTCDDVNGDGICDSPYYLDSNNIDYLPLVSVCYCYNCSDCTSKINDPDCTTIILNNSISSTGTCIDNPQGFSGKTLNCNYHSITGIVAITSNSSNIKIINCNIVVGESGTEDMYGIKLYNNSGVIIDNTNITSTDITNSEDALHSTYGIYMYNTSDSNITNIVIEDFNRSLSYQNRIYGVKIEDSSNIDIDNIVIYKILGGDADEVGTIYDGWDAGNATGVVIIDSNITINNINITWIEGGNGCDAYEADGGDAGWGIGIEITNSLVDITELNCDGVYYGRIGGTSNPDSYSDGAEGKAYCIKLYNDLDIKNTSINGTKISNVKGVTYASGEAEGVYIDTRGMTGIEGYIRIEYINFSNIEDYSIFIASLTPPTTKGTNVIVNNNNFSLKTTGMKIYNMDNVNITNNKFELQNAADQSTAIYLEEGMYLTITGNTITGSTNTNITGITLDDTDSCYIYNNFINTSKHVSFLGTIGPNDWNTTKTAGTSIVGGPYLGGNYWAYPNGTGFSETCTDTDGDGICDDYYNLTNDNIDWLPLTEPYNNALVVELIKPNNYDIVNYNINFICNATTYGSNITNITLYGNWSGGWHANYTNDTSSLGVSSAYLNITLNISDGYYVWNCYACDTSGNCRFADSNYTLIVDTASPTVTLNPGTTEAGYRNVNWIFVNATASNRELDSFLLYFNDVAENWQTCTGDTQQKTCWSNKTGLADGTYGFYAWANDTAGNNASSESRVVIIDTTNPNLTVTYPANNSYINTEWINITGTAYDVNPYQITINDSRFGSNLGTYNNWNFTNSSVEETTYVVKITAEDMANNTNSTVIVFTIDRTYPTIQYVSPTPASGATLYTNDVKINVTLSDANPYQVILDWNGVNETYVWNGESYMEIDKNDLSNGDYYYYVCAVDKANNVQCTEKRTVTIYSKLSEFRTYYYGQHKWPVYFLNNITMRAVGTTDFYWVNFTIKSPTGIYIMNNQNGTYLGNYTWESVPFVLNETGTWITNVTAYDGANVFTDSLTFEITYYVNFTPKNYTYSVHFADYGTNMSYNLSIWHNTDENIYFNFTIGPQYGYNFTYYIQNETLVVGQSSASNPVNNLITIYINKSVIDDEYPINITFWDTNTSTKYVSTLIMAVNPPTGEPRLYDDISGVECTSDKDSDCYCSDTTHPGPGQLVASIFNFKVKNVGNYSLEGCQMRIEWQTAPEVEPEFIIDGSKVNNFSLEMDEEKIVSVRVYSSYYDIGKTLTGNLYVWCDCATRLCMDNENRPENRPLIEIKVESQPESQGPSSGAGGAGGGAGGAGGGIANVDVYAVKQPPQVARQYSEVERAIIYARIYDVASEKPLLTPSDLQEILKAVNGNFTSLGVQPITEDDLKHFLRLYGMEVLDIALVDYNTYKSYLLVATKEQREKFITTPRRIDVPQFVFSFFWNDEVTLVKKITANKVLKSCQVIEGNFTCELAGEEDKVVALVKLKLTNTNFFSKLYSGKVILVSVFNETTTVPITLRVYNPAWSIPIKGGKIGSIPTIMKLFLSVDKQGNLYGIKFFPLLGISIIIVIGVVYRFIIRRKLKESYLYPKVLTLK